ncbi:MAG: LamG-like jellyroll fold domain-containing protein, partial [Spirochaetota bacterium]
MKHLLTALIAIGMLAAAEKPIFYIPFDEGAGTKAKDVVNDVPVKAVKWAPNGKSRAAALFDGTAATVVTVDVPKTLSFGMSDVTVSFWANPSAVTFDDLKDKRRRMIGIVDNYPVVWGVIDLREGGHVSLEFGRKKDGGPTAGTSFNSSGKIKANEWSHIALVVDRQAKKLLLYINGSLDTEKALHPDFDAPLTADRPFTVGSTWQNFSGMIDDVRVYPCTLSADELNERREKFFTGKLAASGVERTIEIRTRTENVRDAATYYIAPSGNDDWTGTLSAPNAAKTDGPFASVNGALAMLRGVKAKGLYNRPVTVIVKNGIYRMSDPITLIPGDGGTKEYPLLIRAEESGKAVLSGGKRIDGWKKNGELWQTEIDAVKEGDWYFHALFINGRRAVRSRHPNTGFFRAANFTKDNKKEFFFKPGDVLAWENIRDVNVWVYHSWTASFHTVDSIDMDQNKIIVKNPSSYPFGKWGDARFYFENVREALDAPGEWYLDRASGTLLYKPLPGEDITKADVIAPAASCLIDVRGDPKNDQFVEYIGFQGLVLTHVDRDFGTADVIDGQAFVNVRKAMVFARGLRNASFSACEFSHGNVHALWLEKGCFDVSVRQCHIFDHGGGGVYIGDTALHTDEKQRTERITVDNCYMHALNLIMHGAHGVWIGKSSYNTLSHNDICDLDYSPIGAGWTWGYA